MLNTGDVAPTMSLTVRGRIIGVLLEVGTDSTPSREEANSVVLRRLRLIAGTEFPEPDPGGTTAMLVHIYSDLIPAADRDIEAALALGELSHHPRAAITTLRLVQQLGRSLMDDSYPPFAIEPAWGRTLGQLIHTVTGVVPSQEDISAARLAQVSRMVERFSSDPRLSPLSIAESLEMSRRALYDLTSPLVGGISEFIRMTRAQRAVRMLVEPACDGLTVAVIAQRTGFSSPRHLRRALSAFYSCTPEAIRSARIAPEIILLLDDYAVEEQAS
ncbi:hypothetical protein BH10ACT7_BH10ACT7_26140 [soil metagenome]